MYLTKIGNRIFSEKYTLYGLYVCICVYLYVPICTFNNTYINWSPSFFLSLTKLMFYTNAYFPFVSGFRFTKYEVQKIMSHYSNFKQMQSSYILLKVTCYGLYLKNWLPLYNFYFFLFFFFFFFFFQSRFLGLMTCSDSIRVSESIRF